MRHAPSLTVASLVGALLLQPSDALGAAYEGRYAFNWLRSPGRQRCVRIDAALAKQLQSQSFSCQGEKRNTSSGAQAAACANRGRSIEYLIFRSRAACERERRDQNANSEE